MKTTIIKHAQGSQQWHTHRASHFNASDCAAMLGLSPYKTRDQLLKEKATGLTDDVDEATQARFDKGHEFEATARPWAEEIIESDLYPVVLAGEHEGLKLSASLDGLTMLEDVSFEHKSANADLIERLDGGEIPFHYHPQMEMGLMLSGAERCLFMASSGVKDELRYAWYEPNLELRDRIIAGWHQLAADLANYTPTEIEVKPAGHTPETLPALRIEVTGMVTASNLAEFKSHAMAVFGGINRKLVTDQDFASAESTVKWCSDVEQRLAAAKQHALSQTASIDQLFKTIDDISAEARAVRLDLDKLVKARKESIRTEIVMDAGKELWKHCNGLKERIGRDLLPTQSADFAGAIKGKRTLESMRNAVATELANAKIKANAVADQISLNLQTIQGHADHEFLFADTAALVLKSPEDLAAVVQNRIAAHKAKEAARIEAERERIAAEERAKAEAEAKRASDEAIARDKAATFAAQSIEAALVMAAQAKPEPVCEIVQIDNSVGAASPLSPPTLRVGQICERLGFVVNSDFLRHLGFEPAATDKAARLYHEQDFPRMCAVLVRHIQRVAQGVAA